MPTSDQPNLDYQIKPATTSNHLAKKESKRVIRQGSGNDKSGSRGGMVEGAPGSSFGLLIRVERREMRGKIRRRGDELIGPLIGP